MISALDARALRGGRASRDRWGRPRGLRLETAVHCVREPSRPQGRSPLPSPESRALRREQTLPYPRGVRALVWDIHRDSCVSMPEVGGRARWVLGRHPSASASAEFPSARKAAAEVRGTNPAGMLRAERPLPELAARHGPDSQFPNAGQRAGRSLS